MSAALLLLSLLHRSSIGGSAPHYEEYPPRSLEPKEDPRSWTAAEVQDWCESVGFHEYREAFLEAGVDGRRLLGMTAPMLRKSLLLPSGEHALVLEMEISELSARRGLLSASELSAHRGTYPLAEGWDAAGVASFLQESGLGQYVSRFATARVDGRALLKLRADQISTLLDGAPNVHEQKGADAEQLVALIAHLRWRSFSESSGKVDL